MILPLMNAMTLKTTTSTSKKTTASQPGSAARPGGRKTRVSATRTGLLLVGLLAVAVATFRFARRRSR